MRDYQLHTTQDQLCFQVKVRTQAEKTYGCGAPGMVYSMLLKSCYHPAGLVYAIYHCMVAMAMGYIYMRYEHEAMQYSKTENNIEQQF